MTAANTTGVARSLAATIGRLVAFIAFYILCTAAASAVLVRPLIWLFGLGGLRIGVDMYLELAAAIAATAIMLRSIDRRSWGDVGLSRQAARLRTMGTGWWMGTAAIGMTCAVLVVTGLMQFVPASEGSGWIGASVRVTLVLIPAALAEEMICRGYLLTVMRDSVGVVAGVVLTSAMFGALHLRNPGATAESVAVVTIAGLALGAVRVALNSLYAAWMAHLAWNWVMAVPLHAPVSGQVFESPVYRAVSAGPAWLSGGAWGPVGGLVAALGMMAGFAYFQARRRREES